MVRILRNITFNEAEIAIFTNVRSLFQGVIIFTTIFIEYIITTNANDTNTTFENIKNATFGGSNYRSAYYF
jgi:hypothetical protein